MKRAAMHRKRHVRRPGRGPAPGLVRVRKGWRATARLPGGVKRNVFLDSQYGSAEAAGAAARAWRAEQLREARVPDAPARRVVLKPRSVSGIVGVHLRPGRRGTSAAWTATFEKDDGRRLQRTWSVRQHGRTRALAHAIAQREAWEIAELGSPLPKAAPGSGTDNGSTTMSTTACSDQPTASGGEPSDEELLERWLNEETDDISGETFIAIYTRYRGLVRDEMERLGLAPHDADLRVGSVFIRADDTRASIPAKISLRDRLLSLAKEVAGDTNWRSTI